MITRSTAFIVVLCLLVVGCIAQSNIGFGIPCTTKAGCRDGLICIPGNASQTHLNLTCEYCSNSAQCSSLDSQSICKRQQFLKSVEYLCLHKNLFGDVSWHDIVAFIIFFTACAFASGGGIGAGGVYVPVLILVGQFVTKEAVPLSNVIVTGASIANLFVNFPKRHQTIPNKPLIDYSVALLIEPQTLGGTVIGVYLHNIFPSYLILLLLILVMTFTTIRTSMKGIELYKKEKIAARKKNLIAQGEDETPLMDIQESRVRRREPIYKIVSWARIAALIIILAISTVLAMLKGGGDDVSMVGVKVCTPAYWGIAAAIFPIIFLVWSTEGFLVVRSSNRKKGTPKQPGEVRWTVPKVMGVGFVSLVAGILASLLGVGGGIIKGPVLLELGLPPDVVSATSAYMIVFTSISATIQYILLGSIMYDYGIVLFCIGFTACVVGRLTLNWVVKKYKKQSIIIFVIAIVIGTSAVLLVVSEVLQFATQGGDNSFHWGCPADD